MGNVSFLTPTYFFSSIRKGSGKSVILSNTAVFLNNSGKKIAIIDFESCTPLKLRNSFPDGIILQEYADISALLSDSNSRYKKAFYFTDTEKISLFPAFKLNNVSSLFLETAMRDFFIQLQTTFDTIFINLPSGTSELEKLPELISKSNIWRGQLPSTIIVSLSDQNSLVKLDKLILQQPAFSYLFNEQTMLFFNKIPLSSHQHKENGFLTASEIKKIFNFPLFFSMSELPEIPTQMLEVQPIVLDNKSILNHSISHFCRLISTLGKGTATENIHSNFSPLLDEHLFNNLSPIIGKLQSLIASSLFLNKSEIQIFLEEDNERYRIRVRICGATQAIRSIETKIPLVNSLPISSPISPINFKHPKMPELTDTSEFSSKDTCISISVRPLYRFDDRFNWNDEFRISKNLDFECIKPNYVSPLILKQIYSLPDIPTLTQILGFIRKKFLHSQYSQEQSRFNTTNITHFFIPPEFNLSYTLKCLSDSFYSTSLQKHIGKKPELRITLNPNFELIYRKDVFISSVEDLFKRNWKISDHLDTIFNDLSSKDPNLSTYSNDFINQKHTMIPLPLFLYQTRYNGQGIEELILPEVLPILEKELCLNSEIPITDNLKPASNKYEPSFELKYCALQNLDNLLISDAKYNFAISTLPTKKINSFLCNIKNLTYENKLLDFNTDKINQKAKQFCNIKHNFKFETIRFINHIKLKPKSDSMKIEQLLLEFDFIINQLVKTSTYIKAFCNADVNINEFKFNTDFACNFFVLHSEPPFIVNTNIKRLSHVFHPPGTSLSNLKYIFDYFIVSKFDLLPTYIPFNSDNSFLQHENANLESNFVVDSLMNSKLSLSYRDFLRIFFTPIKLSNLLCNLKNNTLKKKEYRLVKYPNYFLASNPLDFGLKKPSDIYKINPNRSHIMNSFNKDTGVFVYEDKHIYHSAARADKEFTFPVQDVKLSTLPLRRYFNSLIRVKSRPSIERILTNKLQIHDTKNSLSIQNKFKNYTFLFKGSDVCINYNYPLRHRVYIQPTVEKEPLSMSINTAISNTIFNLKTNVSHLSKKREVRIITPSISSITLERPPLVTPKSNFTLRITIDKPQFHIPVSKANSILFEHLKHILKQHFTSPISSNKKMCIVKSKKDNPRMPLAFSCKEHYSLSDIYDFSPVSFFNHLKIRTILKLKDSRYRDIVKTALKKTIEFTNKGKDNNQ